MLRWLAAVMVLALSVTAPARGAESSGSAEAVKAALTRWTEQFNARDTDQICTLFDRELRYDYRGQPERGYDDICRLLQRSLRDTGRTYSYAFDLKEILVANDLAVVRLVWTLTARPLTAGAETTSQETGMDVFRKHSDGTWKIIRYIAYD